jgi:Lipase (class 3)
MPFDPLEAARYGEYLQFVYEMYDNRPDDLMPPTPPGFEQTGLIITHYLNAIDLWASIKKKRFYGFVARTTSGPTETVIAIRGTRGLQEWLIDFEGWPAPFPGVDGPKLFVEFGFLSVYQTLKAIRVEGGARTRMSHVEGRARDLLRGDEEKLTIVGHSLGSALTTLVAFDLSTQQPTLGEIATIYPFASPRVGDVRFAAAFDALFPQTYRLWNPLDIVPKLPLPIGYKHVAGDGIRLDQTDAQMQYLCPSLSCQHNLLTYLWLLNDPTNPFLADFQAACGCNGAARLAGLRYLNEMRLEADDPLKTEEGFDAID